MERVLRVITPTLRAVRRHQSGSLTPLFLSREHPLWRGVASSFSSVQSSNSAAALSANVANALKSAHKSDDIVAIVQANQLSGDQASLALGALKNATIIPDQESNLSSDERFVALLDSIENQLETLSTESLVNSLINLLKLGHGDHPVVRLLEAECRNSLRAMAIRHLGLLVCNSYLLPKNLANEALRVLQLRWKELNNPFLLKRLLKTSLGLSSTFTERLEDKTLEMVDAYSFQDVVDIAGYFTSARRISTLVMRAISYKVEEQRGQWEISHLLRLIGYMGYSRYYNSVFFKDVAAFCKENLSKCSSRQISEIIRSFGMLRMPEEELFTAVREHLQSHLSEYSLSELQTTASGLSMVNVRPPTQLVKRLAFEFDSLSFTQKIEFCLALAVPNVSSADQMKKMFESTDAVNGVMDSDKPWHIPTQLKLLQLNAHAKTECPSYQGPYLPERITRYPIVRDLASSNLQKDVTSKVEALLGDKKFLNTKVGLDSGYVIDAEIAVDGDGAPLSAIDYNISTSSRDHSPLRKDLPLDARRVAVVVNGPACYLFNSSDLTGRRLLMVRQLQAFGYQLIQHDECPCLLPVNSSDLTGRRLLMVRQLQALGYQLIQVPFDEWSAMKSDAKKMEYLQERLNGVIKLSK